MTVRAEVMRAFRERYGAPPAFMVRAPGRVNLIGEHTDYNDGFVLPMAIDREVWIALRPRGDENVALHSIEFAETSEFGLNEFAHDGHDWIEYVKGVAWVLADSGLHPTGWEGVLSGDVPRGAGLSSSAAVELAAMRAFAAVGAVAWNPTEAALRGRRVENEWIGVNSGIMDQLVIASASAGHALLIDCRTLDTEHVPVPAGISVVVLDTGTRRGLVDSAYNERRAQCERAARIFEVAALRDLTREMLEAGRRRLDKVTFRRARHVVTENKRTVEAAAALRAGNVERFGQLMNASHASLRDEFEVSNDALDTMVAIAQDDSACHGARMTGAGFGGCAVAMVDAEQTERFIKDTTRSYRSKTGLEPSGYACQASGGASLETSIESVPS